MEKVKMGDLEIVRDKDSIKLIKNTKGYFWEIRLVDEENRDMLKDLKLIDTQLTQEYGGEDGTA